MPSAGSSRMKLDNPGITEIFTRFYCNYCQEEINGLRVSCAYCDDFDLCPECFACGAEIGGHKSHHRYFFSNNGQFSVFPKSPPSQELKSARRASLLDKEEGRQQEEDWNVREDTRLLEAVEMYGYGNWKDISKYVETKDEGCVKERYIKCYIQGVVGQQTWDEDTRGVQVDHTQDKDRGPLSPTLTSKLPPINVAPNQALLLGYMPARDDFEDFDRSNEAHVSQMGVKSVEDDDIEIAMKLAHVDIYERALREEVRRKRVARDYQLVSKYFAENPLIPFGVKMSPHKMANLLKMKKEGSGGPKQELMDALKPFCQFNTCHEFKCLVDNLCVEQDLRVRVKELLKYREHGLMKVEHLPSFERQRFRRELRLRQNWKKHEKNARLLPRAEDYSVHAFRNPEYETDPSLQGERSRIAAVHAGRKKRKKWSNLKKKTGKRLLLSMGCTLATPEESPLTTEAAETEQESDTDA